MLAAGRNRATSKPHRRAPGHKPMSLEQVEFARRARAEGKRPVARAMGPDASRVLPPPSKPIRGGAAGGSGRRDDRALDLAGAIAADADARAAAAAVADAARRGGRGYLATRGRNDKSDASLAALDLADEETVRELLGRLPVGHLNERARLSASLESQYARWWQLLQSEFSLLLYGFGSKKELMEDFAQKTLTDGGVVVVNGFFPGLTAKQVLVAAAAAVHRESAANSAGATPHGASNDALFNRIALATRRPDVRAAPARGGAEGRGARERPRRGEGGEIGADGVNGDFQPLRRLYIVLHNIDGQQLRSPEAQAILGELASMPRVHLIASVDHVNAPLLWSKREAARFNWVWQEATTFAPYALETSFLPQLLASKGEERHIRGAVNVLRSLTSNARDIFRLLAEHQLANPEEKGMGFHAFYTECRAQFLATSEVTLRSHLTEFVDHELTRTRKSADGEDVVHIPFAADVLAQLLKEINTI